MIDVERGRNEYGNKRPGDRDNEIGRDREDMCRYIYVEGERMNLALAIGFSGVFVFVRIAFRRDDCCTSGAHVSGSVVQHSQPLAICGIYSSSLNSLLPSSLSPLPSSLSPLPSSSLILERYKAKTIKCATKRRPDQKHHHYSKASAMVNSKPRLSSWIRNVDIIASNRNTSLLLTSAEEQSSECEKEKEVTTKKLNIICDEKCSYWMITRKCKRKSGSCKSHRKPNRSWNGDKKKCLPTRALPTLPTLPTLSALPTLWDKITHSFDTLFVVNTHKRTNRRRLLFDLTFLLFLPPPPFPFAMWWKDCRQRRHSATAHRRSLTLIYARRGRKKRQEAEMSAEEEADEEKEGGGRERIKDKKKSSAIDANAFIQSALDEGKVKMTERLTAMSERFMRFQPGQLTPAMLDAAQVDLPNGTSSPIRRLAVISGVDASALRIEPHDKDFLPDIASAIREAFPDCAAVSDGKIITMRIAAMTTARRKDVVKQIKTIAEDCKVALRNIRRNLIDQIRKMKNDGKVGEDASRSFQDDVQKLTNQFTKQTEELCAKKERQMLAI